MRGTRVRAVHAWMISQAMPATGPTMIAPIDITPYEEAHEELLRTTVKAVAGDKADLIDLVVVESPAGPAIIDNAPRCRADRRRPPRPRRREVARARLGQQLRGAARDLPRARGASARTTTERQSTLRSLGRGFSLSPPGLPTQAPHRRHLHSSDGHCPPRVDDERPRRARVPHPPGVGVGCARRRGLRRDDERPGRPADGARRQRPVLDADGDRRAAGARRHRQDAFPHARRPPGRSGADALQATAAARSASRRSRAAR